MKRWGEHPIPIACFHTYSSNIKNKKIIQIEVTNDMDFSRTKRLAINVRFPTTTVEPVGISQCRNNIVMKTAMKRQSALWRMSGLIGVFVFGLGLTLAHAQPPETNAPPQKVEQKKLTGAELYAVNCNRCHAERYPMEWNAAQWKTLVTHMRVRAGIPAAQANKILKYLQEDSGN